MSERNGLFAASPPWWKAVAIAFAAALLGTLAANWLGGLGRAPLLHPAMPVALGLLLRWQLPWLRGAALLLAAAVAVAAAHLLLGGSALAAAQAAGGQLLEAALVVAGLQVLNVDRVLLSGLRSLAAAARLALLVLAAPVAGAALAMLAGAGDVATLQRWWTASACGYLLILPVVVAWLPASAGPVPAMPSRPRALALAFAVAIAALGIVATSTSYLLLALLLLVPALWLGVAATAVIGLVVALLPLALHAFRAAALDFDVLDPQHHLTLSTLAVTLAVLVALLELQRRRDAQQGRASGDTLGLVLDQVPALVFGVSREQRFRVVNRAFEQWFGKRASDVVGRTPADVFGEAVTARMGSRIQRVLAGQPQHFELATADGRDLDVRYEPQRGPDGDIDGFLALAQDVSWRRQSQRHLAALFDAAPDALLVVGEGGRIAAANARLAAMFGHAPDGMAGQPLEALVPGLTGQVLDRTVAEHGLAVMRTDAEGAPLQGYHRDGHVFQVELMPGALQDALGPGRLCAVRRTVERAQDARAAQQDKDRAQVILDAIGDAVVACDPDLFVTLFNPVAEQMTGWRREEALGRPLDDIVRMIDATAGDRLLSPMRTALETQQPVALGSQAMLVRRGGEQAAVETSAAPIVDPDGGISGGVMVFRDISQTHAMALEMSHLAQHDYLTHLPNRVLLHDRLSQELAKTREGRKGALLFLDLDFFKHINDSLGHAVGDKVLQEISRRLLESVREDDTVSRQGGDEFVLLLVRMADPRDAARVAEKLIQAIERPIPHEGQDLHVSASIGIALFPQDARDIKTLMIQADTALYHAKQSGRGRYSYFTASMSERADQRLRMEHDLRLALSHGDFFLVYQPKVQLDDGAMTGMEALVRWRTSDGVMMSPAEFIPVAEETGLVVPLDEWVMHEACRQNKAWQDAGLPRLPVSVNVSLARFDADRLLQSVRHALESSGLEPQYLEIEFTESQMFVHQERAQQLIEDFKALGVQLAVDDFGVGYSSLSYLVQYRFDTLKIDRSFIQGLPGEAKQYAVVQAIIGMAQALGYRVVAEGVETVEQADVLARHGCNEVQGYLFSRPVPADHFEGLLRSGEIRLPHMRALRTAS